MQFVHIFLLVSGIVTLAGLCSVIYTLPRVKPHWRPAYWMAIGLALSLLVALTAAGLRSVGVQLAPQTVLWTLKTAIFLTALELVLVPAIHRWERKLDF